MAPRGMWGLHSVAVMITGIGRTTISMDATTVLQGYPRLLIKHRVRGQNAMSQRALTVYAIKILE